MYPFLSPQPIFRVPVVANAVPAARVSDPREALPYEYDEYYNTRVSRPWTRLSLPVVLGIFLIIFGIFSIIWSSINIARSVLEIPYFNNPNFNKVFRTQGENPNLAAVWNENSIWPSFGCGIWVGFLMIGTGYLSIVSKRDGSFVSLYALNILSWICCIFSLYQRPTAITEIEPYPYNSVFNRNYRQNLELAMACLLLIFGIFSFLTSLMIALKSCYYLDYCSNGKLYVIKF